jgi:hypothetical protein
MRQNFLEEALVVSIICVLGILGALYFGARLNNSAPLTYEPLLSDARQPDGCELSEHQVRQFWGRAEAMTSYDHPNKEAYVNERTRKTAEIAVQLCREFSDTRSTPLPPSLQRLIGR